MTQELDASDETVEVTQTSDEFGATYAKTATIRAKQWWEIGDHPGVTMANDVTEAIRSGQAVPWCDTLEGGHVVSPGDWIATGIKGEHWPIKPDVFAATYAPIEPPMNFGEVIDPNASHNRRHRIAATRTSSPETRVLVEALADIREHTDPDGLDNYRSDDREGCLDAVFARADRALAALSLVREGEK